MAALGIGSQIAFQFRAGHNHVRGGLNLYAVKAGPVDPGTMQLGELFATQIAVIMGWERQVQNLNIALTNRELIGTAIGILVERYKITPERAFGFLLRTSQDGNLKLHAVAAAVVDEAVGDSK